MHRKKETPPMDVQSLSNPLGRGGTPRPEPPNMRTALGVRDKGQEAHFDRDHNLKGPLGR